MSRASSAVGPEHGEGGPAPADRSLGFVGDRALRVAGGLVALAGAVVTAAVEVTLAMLRVGTVRVPVSPLIAVAANLTLIWFTYQTTGRRWAVALPAVAWIVVMAGVAGRRTTEGDLLLTGDNWVGQVTLFAGAVAFGLGAYRLIVLRPLGSARSDPARSDPACPDPVGSDPARSGSARSGSARDH